MTLFEVWVPEKTVKLRLAGEDREMERAEDGWWRLDVPGAAPGSDYAFILAEQDTPLPDPRSAWQPQGVHAASQLVGQQPIHHLMSRHWPLTGEVGRNQHHFKMRFRIGRHAVHMRFINHF